MKVALCFIINYDHVLNKEDIWREWIEPNKDIINIYVYYKDFNKIKSPWLKQYTLPEKYIFSTNYYNIIPAYISLMEYAKINNKENQWFCFLTDSCCPIISPLRFRYLFYKNCNKSIMHWSHSWWNIQFHQRANLKLLPLDYHLANDPWFILRREEVNSIIYFVKTQEKLTNLICNGGLANESLFAIILQCKNRLKNTICAITHITDWSRMTSSTSPYVFAKNKQQDQTFIEHELKKHPYAIFIRKVAIKLPNKFLQNFIYENPLTQLNWMEYCHLSALNCFYKSFNVFYIFNVFHVFSLVSLCIISFGFWLFIKV